MGRKFVPLQPFKEGTGTSLIAGLHSSNPVPDRSLSVRAQAIVRAAKTYTQTQLDSK